MATMSGFGNTANQYEGAPAPGAVRRLFTAIDTFLGGAADGAEADRAYHDLIRRGVPHAKAAEMVLERHLRAC
jgi:hypothetical protein